MFASNKQQQQKKSFIFAHQNAILHIIQIQNDLVFFSISEKKKLSLGTKYHFGSYSRFIFEVQVQSVLKCSHFSRLLLFWKRKQRDKERKAIHKSVNSNRISIMQIRYVYIHIV